MRQEHGTHKYRESAPAEDTQISQRVKFAKNSLACLIIPSLDLAPLLPFANILSAPPLPDATLLGSHLDTLPQTLHHQLLAGKTAINVPDVVRGGLEMAAGVVALGNEDVVLGAVLDGLVQGDWRALLM
jgi:hypothetical protein